MVVDLKMLRNELIFGTATTLVGVLAIAGLAFVMHAYAAVTITVCDTACDYTTITDAINIGVPVPGDTIAVGADYASTTETFPISVPTGVNLDCQNSGAVIGVDDENNRVNIHPLSDNIFRDCQYSNVSIESNNQSNIQVLDNTFFENSRISTNNVTDITATGNTGLKNINIGNTVGAIIDSNTINSLSYANGDAFQINNSTSVQFTRNVITDSATSTPTGNQIIGIGGNSYDIYFATNTVLMPSSTFSGGGLSVLEITNSLRITVRDNVFSMSGNGGGIQVLNLNGSAGDISVDTQHNTILMNDPCNQCSGILMSSWNVADVSVTSSFNLIVGTTPSSTANMQGHSSYGAGPSSSLHLFTEYEGFVGLNVNGTTDFPTASNSIVRRYSPLRINDATSTNDNELVPYSAFLDVSGTEDVGAIPGVRGDDFHIDATGTIDYSSIDATDTTMVVESLRNSDTVHLATGDYSAILLSLQIDGSPFSSDVTFLGAGAGTVVHATSSDALFIGGISNSNFSDMTFTGASSTPTSTYSITRAQYTDGVTTYDQGAFIGAPNGIIIIKSVPAGNTCDTSIYDADGFDVTSIVGPAADDWNLFLVDYLGIKLTIFAPDRFIPDAITLPDCANPGDITVEHEVSGIFTVSGGIYTYNTVAAATAGVSPKIGETNPPALTKGTIGGDESGIHIDDATNNQFTNVTSTGNSNGIRFIGVAGNTTFTNSALSQNSSYDILDDSSGDNTLIDTSLIATSSSMLNNGVVRVKFSARAFVQDNASAPVSGANVTFASNNGASSTVLVTDATGFTPYTSTALPAFTLSSSTNAETAGGFNPYSISVATIGGHPSANMTSNLRTPNQTFSVTLAAAPSGGSGGGGGAGGLPSTSGNPSSVPTASESASIATRLYVYDSLGRHIHDLVKLQDDGNVVTQDDSTVYYLGADGFRHAFPNPSTYFSWYCDFSNVKIIAPQDLARIPLGKNVTYRSGVRLVKFTTAPMVYLVDHGAVLRSIPDEAFARALAGNDWARTVSDISDAFYGDYTVDGPLDSSNALNYPFTSAYPSDNFHIAGYRDPGKSGENCPQYGPTLWPYELIPRDFQFTLTLTTGSSASTEIRYLQEVLSSFGDAIYPEDMLDGIYHSYVKSAVRRFQQAHGISNTGNVGPATRAALNAILDSYR